MTYKRDPDHFSRKAKKEGFAARSIYKLEEIDRRIRLLRPGLRVLDLGAAPGSWTQYAGPKIGARGRIVAVDLNPLRVAIGPQLKAIQMDVFKASLDDFRALGPFDVVLSDMAPHTSGIRDADVARSCELVERALEIAGAVLVPGGKFLAKIFQGDGFEEVRAHMRVMFDEVRILKPEASKRESTEIYLAGIGRKP
ncbi:MAG: RlmE family RNA methyltransferase [Deltaproteobacteria bacterium]